MKKAIGHIGMMFLFMAAFIILAHNIIPHHHHISSNNPIECEQTCDHHDDKSENPVLSILDNHEHDPLCDGCHFNIEVTNSFEKFSVDSHFCTCTNCTKTILTKTEEYKFSVSVLSYKFLFASKQRSRGPPVC